MQLRWPLPLILNAHGKRALEAFGRFDYVPGDLALNNSVLRRVPHLKDRKSTRLNSSHLGISYAVFCLKKKKFIKAHHDANVRMQELRAAFVELVVKPFDDDALLESVR